ncbi:SET domain-containing protein [Patellaria atrata CBS 101060]|uniref:SET domain-containing protein n=1 Tax=Patellaria atrata CBS 101060 TaxID=1346257 RepID=A0A9P4SE61_9PEZI|nr:SET domain-containing protein [Patellaria atrata CBS 101060]
MADLFSFVCLLVLHASLISCSSVFLDTSTVSCRNDNQIFFSYNTCINSHSSNVTSTDDEEIFNEDASSTLERKHSLWPYEPLCTGLRKGLDEELCIYTNAEFAGGRGISIFTTRKIAESFKSLPPFHSPEVLDGINKPTTAWSTRKMPNKGIGMVAESKFQRGNRILVTTPVLLAHMDFAMADEDVFPVLEREAFLRKAVDQLPTRTRDAFLSLATLFNAPHLVVQDVMKTNAFEIQVGGQMHLAVFPEAARINHDCGPNAMYYLDPENLTHHVHAVREIKPGEEINIASNPPDTLPLVPTPTRQSIFHTGFGFTCTCSRCTDPSSDSALTALLSLQSTLSDWSSPSAGDPVQGLRLIEMYEQQGLHGFLDEPYGLQAVALCPQIHLNIDRFFYSSTLISKEYRVQLFFFFLLRYQLSRPKPSQSTHSAPPIFISLLISYQYLPKLLGTPRFELLKFMEASPDSESCPSIQISDEVENNCGGASRGVIYRGQIDMKECVCVRVSNLDGVLSDWKSIVKVAQHLERVEGELFVLVGVVSLQILARVFEEW